MKLLQHIIWIVGLCLVVSSCNNRPTEPKTPVILSNYKYVENSNQKNEYSDFHRALYIGKHLDTIVINKSSMDPYYERQDSIIYAKSIDENGNIKFIELKPLSSNYYISQRQLFKIVVDTTREIVVPKSIWKNDTNFKAYPVIIKNFTDKKNAIGIGNKIDFLVEAKNSLGSWEQIEKPFIYTCGTNLENLWLETNEIAISEVEIPNGSFKTKLRLNLAGSYSNVFTSYIDPNKFIVGQKERFDSRPR